MLKFKDLRKEKQLLQKDIADFLGVDRTTYVKYENGNTEPPLNILQKLADYFDVSLDYLLGRDVKEKNPLDKELEGIDFALFGEVKEMTEAQKRDVLKFAQFLKQKNND